MFHPHHEIDRLAHQIRCARAVTPALFSDVVAQASTRLPALRGAADLFARLLTAGAWIDAALALIALELPAWRLRRIAFEDGAWRCCLSRQPNLPPELDDTAEGSHELLPLAILSAFLAALDCHVGDQSRPPHWVPPMRRAACGVCCDDFA